VSGFSPFVTFTFLSTDLDTGTAKKRIGVFIKRGKVPVWSFDEIVDPTFNQPLSLAVKELASKVANQMYGYRASDKTVDDLVAKLSGKREPESFLDVYALGFTNNPKAIEPVAKLTTDPDEYVRLAAISSLGNLRATSHFDFLKGIYQNRSSLWQDRAMALKSIADLDTNEAKAFVTGELKYWQAQPPSNESTWTSQIIRLYY
jgi:HEAT repeat protein